MKLRSSKTKLFYETSFKTEASKLKNQAFLRNFLQKWSFEALKRSFSARLPSKMKLQNLKTKLFCETSFKNDTSGTDRVTGDHKEDAPFLCDRCGTPSMTLGHLWPYLFYFKTWKQWIGSQATNVPFTALSSSSFLILLILLVLLLLFSSASLSGFHLECTSNSLGGTYVNLH